jgi:hypothetical protein
MNSIRLTFVGAAVLAFTAVLIQGERRNAALRSEIGQLRNRTKDGAVLREENTRLVTNEPARAEKMRRDLEELGRLSAQVSRMEGQLKEVESLRNRPAAPEHPVTRIVPLPGMIAQEALQNVGRATPSNLAQTNLWAWIHGDWQTIADSRVYDPKDEATLKALFLELSPEEQARCGSPERMVFMLSAGNGPVSAQQLAEAPPVGIAAEKALGPDDVEIVQRRQISPEKVVDDPPIRAHHFPDGWKFMMPLGIAEQLKASIGATPPTQRLAAGKR